MPEAEHRPKTPFAGRQECLLAALALALALLSYFVLVVQAATRSREAMKQEQRAGLRPAAWHAPSTPPNGRP